MVYQHVKINSALMENSHFVHVLSHQFDLSENGEKMLNARIRKITVPKGTPLLRPGEVCRQVYFIEHGFLRQYRDIDGEEQTTDFMPKGHFSTVLESFIHQKRSEEGLVCETETQLYALSYYDLMALEDSSLEFLLLSKKLVTSYLLRIYREKEIYLRGNAIEKFAYLCAHYPGIRACIKHKDLASYLGITQQSFSRMLKQELTKG